MLRSDFLALPEWQAIERKLREWIEGAREHALESVASGRQETILIATSHDAGFVEALGFVIDLPNKLFSDGEPLPPEQEGLPINRPKQTRIY